MKDAARGTGRQPPPFQPAKDRESGTRLTSPSPESSTHFAPLPLGAEAFMAPLAPAADSDDESAPRSRKLVILGVVGVIVGGLAGAGVLMLALNRSPIPITPEDAPHTSVPAKSRTRPTYGISAAEAHASEPEPSRETPSAHEPAPAPGAASAPIVASLPEAPPKPLTAAEEAARERRHARRAERRKEKERGASLPDKPSRADVIAAMSKVQRQVKACFPAGHGSATADITVLGSTGRITTAQVSGQQGEIGSCIARAVRKAKFPKFSSGTISIRYPMAL